MFTKQMDEKVNKILNEVQVLNEEGEDVFIKFSDCNIDISDILWDEVEVLDWTIIWKSVTMKFLTIACHQEQYLMWYSRKCYIYFIYLSCLQQHLFLKFIPIHWDTYLYLYPLTPSFP